MCVSLRSKIAQKAPFSVTSGLVGASVSEAPQFTSAILLVIEAWRNSSQGQVK
jgi:hypothetical protein